MANLMKRTGSFHLPRPSRGHFAALAESILHQQLAGAAARAIHGRFVALFDGDLSPEAVLAVPPRKLRAAGLSGRKVASIRDLAAKVVDGTVPLDRIGRLADEDVITRLSVVRGIGQWTAEMFLIFQLRRLDVRPVGDYGVRKGYALAYDLRKLPTPKQLEGEGERFRPYRTVAAGYCWQRGSFNRALLEAAGQLALGRMTISPIEIGELARTPGGGCARAIRCGAPADARRHSPRPLGVARSICALDRPGAGR